MRHNAEEDKLEARMVPLLVDAMYPVLFPVEQQDMRIQAANRARVTEAATTAWRAFRMLGIGEKKVTVTVTPRPLR